MAELKTKLEDVSAIKKKIEVSIPVEKVKAAWEEELKKIGGEAKIKGFRKGKIPPHLLEKYFAEEATREAAERLVRESYPEALEKENARPISAPMVEAGAFKKDESFNYTATFEIRPQIEVKGFTGLKLERPEVSVTAEEITNQLKLIQERMTQLEPLPKETKAETGMVAVIDFKGSADGKPFPGSEAKDFMVEIGGGHILADLEKGLLGMAKGEEKNVELNYPADYFNKDLAGKKGRFHVKLKEVKKKITPELNDEFAKDLGDYKNLEGVKKEIEKRILDAKEREVKRILTSQVLEQLVASHSFEVPESMVSGELKGMFESFVRHLSSQGKKFEDSGMSLEDFIKNYKGDAETRVRSFLIMDAIADLEKIAVSDHDLEERLKIIAEQSGQPIPKVRQQYESNNLLGGLKVQIRHEKATDLIIDKAKINPSTKARG